MAQHEGEAFVLDATDYRESSSLVRLLTENEGRISLVAKGLRKPKSNGGSAIVQPFNLLNVRYILRDGQTLGTLAGADIVSAWNSPRNNLETYALATYWFEVLKESSQARESSGGIFQLTRELLDSQETAPGFSMKFLHLLSDLCRQLGFGLSWSQCSFCGKVSPNPEKFSVKTGVICFQCAEAGREGILLRPDEQTLIHNITQHQDQPPGNESYSTMLSLLTLMNRFLVYHLEHPLKSFGFVTSTLAS